nr:RNA-directed DNA polymerase, eukaryota [Tanacetum cinerariifolium]
LVAVIPDIVSDTQYAFVANRNILDGPFILNEIIDWRVVQKNLVNLIRILDCFYLASGLKINLHKSQVLGVGIPRDVIDQGATLIGYDVLHSPFRYLGITVGDHMSRYSAWSSSIQKVKNRLSKWKSKTLSVGGRLTLLKSVLGAVLLYTMSLYKAPKRVLSEMESIRSKFFNGGDQSDKKSHGSHGIRSYRLRRKESLTSLTDSVSLSSSFDRWVFDLNGDGTFQVKDIRSSLDEIFLPSSDLATRWVNFIPNKINVFTWRACLDLLQTRLNLVIRDVPLDSTLCPSYNLCNEDSSHVFLECELAKSILRRICKWWDIEYRDASTFS